MMTAGVTSALGGQRFFLLAAALLTTMTAAIIAIGDGSVESVRLVIRATARTSLFFFLAAFSASALARLWPGTVADWLIANRRWLGLSFAFSHLIHAGAIILLYNHDEPLFWTLTNKGSIVAGSIAYLFIALMAGTSFDRMVAALGPRGWKWLHTAGLWYVWITFMVSNGKRIPISAGYAVPMVLLLGALLLRIAARRSSGRAAA